MKPLKSITNLSLITLPVIMLAGCAQSDSTMENDSQAMESTYQYQCMSGESFTVEYLTEDDTAILRIHDEEHSLKQIPSGSGVKYVSEDNMDASMSDMKITLFTKGQEARLELGRNIYKNCDTE